MQNRRNSYIDLVKYLLITFVVLGHFIQFFQYKSNLSLFWSSNIFKFIYTFHMPLFMAISGYFAYFSISRQTPLKYIISRIKYLLIPLLIWACLSSLIIFSTAKPSETTPLLSLFQNSFLHSFWFVWAIIFFSILLCLLKKIKADKAPILLISTLLILYIPSDYFRIDVGKEFFIYFAIGYLLANKGITAYHQFCKKYLILFIAIATICFIYWNPLLSFEGFLGLKGWIAYLFRILLAISSTVCVMEITYWIYSKIQKMKITNYFAKIGQETLGIYLIQDVFINTAWHRIIPYVNFPNVSLTYIIPSVLLVTICYYFITIVSKNKTAGLLLFGKK